MLSVCTGKTNAEYHSISYHVIWHNTGKSKGPEAATALLT